MTADFQPDELLPKLVTETMIATPYGLEILQVYDCPTLHDGTVAHGRLFLALPAGQVRDLNPAHTVDGVAVPAIPDGPAIGMSTVSADDAINVASANLAAAAKLLPPA